MKMKKLNKSNHVGWERVYLEQISVLDVQKKEVENELLAILDRLTNSSVAYKQRKQRIVYIEDKIGVLERKVDYHIGKQMKGK